MPVHFEEKKECTNQFHACDTIRLGYSIGLFGAVIVVVCYCSWSLLRAAISFECVLKYLGEGFTLNKFDTIVYNYIHSSYQVFDNNLVS